MADCVHLVTENGAFIVTELGYSFVTDAACTDPVTDGFGLARLFYWQQEQARLRRNRQQTEEEELLVMLGLM